MNNDVITVRGLKKVYGGGFEALKGVDLDIRKGEILALLGPNGAGKTTLISTLCGITVPSSGTASVGGHDIVSDFRHARGMIGLVPQELTLEAFETVMNTVRFSRGLFGKPRNDAYLEKLLDDLNLGSKKDSKIMMLSGGMKRRVLIAKALSHEPSVLFLDEPTAGVDVELRKDMWAIVDRLRQTGVTIILTTHYIEEAEAMADRIAVIDKGRIMLVQDKHELMRHMGKKTLRLQVSEPLTAIPESVAHYNLELSDDGQHLIYTYDTKGERTGITGLLSALQAAGVQMVDLETRQSSLEDIFVGLVKETA